MFRSLLQPMWNFTIHPLKGPTSSLVPVTGSDTICTNSSSPLVDIVCFSPTYRPYIRNFSLLSPTDVESHDTRAIIDKYSFSRDWWLGWPTFLLIWFEMSHEFKVKNKNVGCDSWVEGQKVQKTKICGASRETIA